MFTNITFEHINDDYAWGKYMGDFKVIIMKKNGYINATKLCTLGGKHYKHWKENKGTKELFDAFNDSRNATATI
jgi:hypothetical protein